MIESLTRHGGPYGAREARLEVWDAHPFRPTRDADHLGGHLAYPRHLFSPLFLAEVPLCAGLVPEADPFHRLDVGGTPDEQGVVGRARCREP